MSLKILTNPNPENHVVYAMVENEKVKLGEVEACYTLGDEPEYLFRMRQDYENGTIYLTGFLSIEMGYNIAKWAVGTNDGDVYHYYTDFTFERLQDATQETNFFHVLNKELVLMPMEYDEVENLFKKAVAEN